MHNMAQWVVVIGDERIGDLNTVMPIRMPVRQLATTGRVQQVCMNVVLQDLLICKRLVTISSNAQGTYIP